METLKVKIKATIFIYINIRNSAARYGDVAICCTKFCDISLEVSLFRQLKVERKSNFVKEMGTSMQSCFSGHRYRIQL